MKKLLIGGAIFLIAKYALGKKELIDNLSFKIIDAKFDLRIFGTNRITILVQLDNKTTKSLMIQNINGIIKINGTKISEVVMNEKTLIKQNEKTNIPLEFIITSSEIIKFIIDIWKNKTIINFKGNVVADGFTFPIDYNYTLSI
jgi:hypothetical protein